MEITKEQWKSYRLVQDSGAYNMFDPNARAMTNLTSSIIYSLGSKRNGR